MSLSGGSLLEVLPWDSEFFGVRIARAEPGPGDLDALVAAAREDGVDCLYLTVDGEELGLVEESIRRGARLVEFRLRAHRSRRRATGPPSSLVRRAGADDLPMLIGLARELADMSRFAVDPRFPPDRVAELYELQIRRCLDTGVVFVPAGEERGLCAAWVDGGDAYIPLAYTEAAARPLALGYALVRAVLENLPARRVFASSKASNTPMIRSSLALGFRIFEFKVLLHLWVDELSGA